MNAALFFLMVSLAGASELVKPNGAGATQSPSKSTRMFPYETVELNNCVPKNGPDGRPEGPVEAAAERADLPKEEILARLIFGETLSTGFFKGRCEVDPKIQAPEKAIMEAQGWCILKRVHDLKKIKQDPYTAAIFAKGQFRTSFSANEQNPFSVAFLCPLKASTYLETTTLKPKANELYKQAQEMSRKLIAEYEAKGIPAKYKRNIHFFSPNSEFGGNIRAPWAPSKVARENPGYAPLLGDVDKPCVEFYDPPPPR